VNFITAELLGYRLTAEASPSIKAMSNKIEGNSKGKMALKALVPLIRLASSDSFLSTSLGMSIKRFRYLTSWGGSAVNPI